MPSRAAERIDFIQRYCIVPNTGKPIVLLPFQTDFIEALFTDGILTAGLSIPRGNGKTGLLACIALSELFCHPHAPDVALAATTVRQAAKPSGVYGVAKQMVLLHPDLLEDVQIVRNNNGARLDLKGKRSLAKSPIGQIECIAAKDPDGLLGGSWSMAIVDEFGSDFWTDERWGNVVQSTGKRGTDSRVVGISTPNSPRSAMFTLRNAVLSGTASKYVSWTEYAADESDALDDRSAWFKANPALGHFLAIEALEQDVTDAPPYLFRMMRLGQWWEMDETGWLGLEGAMNWDATAQDITFDPALPVYIGVDKSAYNDCSAVVALQRDGDRWLSIATIFTPANGIIDHKAVKQRIRELCNLYKVAAVGYDDRYFVEGAAELEDEGLPMLQIPQSSQRMSPAYSELQRAITARLFYHQPDAEYRKHVLSAVISGGYDNESIMLSKRKSRMKIDAAVATALAISASGFADAPYNPQHFWIAKL